MPQPFLAHRQKSVFRHALELSNRKLCAGKMIRAKHDIYKQHTLSPVFNLAEDAGHAGGTSETGPYPKGVLVILSRGLLVTKLS